VFRKTLFLIVLCASIMGLLNAGAALAQVSTPEQEARLRKMTAAPLDHDNTFAFVKASIATRDYEAAIAALERILLYNPHLTRAKYELGVLYYRMASYHQSVLHLEDAASDPALDPAIRRRLEAFLPLAQKQLQASRFTGVVQVGIRYNSNLLGLPSFGPLSSFGITALPANPQRIRGDSGAFALADVSHTYDFQNARGDSWQTRVAGYGTRQFRETDFSIGLFEASTGPVLALAPEMLPGVMINPTLNGGASMIDGRRYGSSFGGGVNLIVPLSSFFTITAGLDGRRIDVQSVQGGLGSDTLSSGTLWTGSLAVNWSVTDAITFNGKVFSRRNTAERGGIDTNHLGLEASVKLEFDPPTDAIGLRWSVTPFVRYTQVDFSRPEPAIDPRVKRRDGQLRAGVQFDAPITPLLGFSGTAQITEVSSNIPNFRSSSWSVMAGPTLRF
jgi:hypothetical protein